MSTRRGVASGRRWLWGGAAVPALAAALVIGVIVASGTNDAASPTSVAASGAPVSLEGTSPITGQEVSFSDFQGRPIVLNIWASWCTGCREEARDLAAFASAHPEAQVVGLDTQDTDGDARGFYREFGWSHPSIRDPDGSAAARFGLQGLPTTIFLDRRHRIVTRIIGATNLAGFEQGLEQATSV